MSEEFLYPLNCPNIVLVGEPRVGKSCFLARLMDMFAVYEERGFFTRPFRERPPTEYTPTSLFSCFMNIEAHEVCHVCYCVRMFDTGGRTEFDYLRPMAYLKANVFVYCFDTSRLETLERVYQKKWLPELKRYKPAVPVIVVGIDQGQESDISQKLETAKNVCGNLTLLKTCCVKTGTGVFGVIEAALALALRHRHCSSRVIQPSRGLFTSWSRHQGSRPTARSISMPPDSHPTIEISPSTYGEDLGQLLTDTVDSDIKFLFQDRHPPVEAHKIVLCSTSAVFRSLFMAKDYENNELEEIFDSVSCQCELQLNSAMKLWKKHLCGTKLEITFKNNISGEAYSCFLRTLYTGSLQIPTSKEGTVISDICVYLASKFRVSGPLQDVISFSIEKAPQEKSFEQELLVKKANAETGNTMKTLFMNRKTFSDLALVVEGSELYVHKAILRSRSKVMAALLGAAFYEKNQEKVELPDLSLDSFTPLLEYLYSDVYTAERSDPHDVLILADRFCQQRLFQICECEISKTLSSLLWKNNNELLTKTVEVFQVAKAFNASQLIRWCVQFIALNYTLYQDNPAYKDLIKGDDRIFVETHRWPTQDDMEALRQYKRMMKISQESQKCCTVL